MNVLLVGSGGREHALAWKLSQSRNLSRLFTSPGNAGAAALGTNLPVSDTDIDGLIRAAREHDIGLTVVGPEAPLAAGLADALAAEGMAVFGPTRAAARIESSKVWAKQFMRRHGIPTAAATVVESLDDAEASLSKMCEGPVAVKADGLAAGKGVVVAASKADALMAARSMLNGAFGEAGRRLLLEEYLTGPELSVFAFVDGRTVSAEVAACDYKRIGDGDSGPNTGGMGSYSPPEFWTPELAREARGKILEPAARGLADEGCPFRGFLYAGLMLTPAGLRVIEFNCRLGDPEAQVVLPRLRSDLLDVCLAVAEGRLSTCEVAWSPERYVAVVMASGGYPGSYQTGKPIAGIDDAGPAGLVFHAGAARTDEGAIVTSGGRVLAAVAGGATFREARRQAYEIVNRIEFEGAVYRRDIAERAVRSETQTGA